MWDSSLRNIVRGLRRRLKKGSGGLLELLQVFLELWMHWLCCCLSEGNGIAPIDSVCVEE